MMDIKQKTITGVAWSAVERFSVQIVQFVVQIIIARLLFPSDYGMISMLAIFMAIAQTFTDGGFGNALIQKKDRTNTDYSTVFYFNISVGIILSIILFLSSGLISQFYNMPELKPIVQVMSVNLVILSFQVIQKTILTIKIDFKTQAKASLIGVLIGGAIGIIMAYKGYGAWALVAQFTTINIIQTALFWYFVKWKPIREFSKDSFKRLFNFGSKILGANLLQTIYLNLYTLVIGKQFSATTLGYYSRADQFAQFPSSNITGIIWRVTYPIMSEIQDDDLKLKQVFRQYIKLSAFIVFPIMVGLAAMAEPFIIIILTEKWKGIVPILQIISFYYMLYPLNAISQNLMQVKGRSDMFFRLEIVKKLIGIALLFISLPFGIYYVCSSLIAYGLINLSINIYYNSKLIDFKIKDQIRDIIKIFFVSIIMGLVVYSINLTPLSNIPKLLTGTIIGSITYLILSHITKIPELKTLRNLIKK
ncbi:MAG TPA: lipopolysaccharide biosynthesis protein [Bacteroidales bacterium]|nr:lipopolysaccharide biosynthesis protein [Bacteroidales bacterium]